MMFILIFFFGGGGRQAGRQAIFRDFFCSVNCIQLISCGWICFWRKVMPRSKLLQPVIFKDILLFLVLCLQSWFSLNLACFLTVDQDTTSKAEKTSKCRSGKNYRSSSPCIDSQVSQESARLHPILWAIILWGRDKSLEKSWIQMYRKIPLHQISRLLTFMYKDSLQLSDAITLVRNFVHSNCSQHGRKSLQTSFWGKITELKLLFN